MTRLALCLLLGVGCQSDDTRLHLDVAADAAWALDSYQLRIGPHAALASAVPELDVVVPDDMADQTSTLDVWGLSAGVQVAYGSVTVTPRLHESVPVHLALGAIMCGTWCNQGDVGCANNGTITCMMQPDGCVAWSSVTPCPSDAPYCSNGACAAQCTDECTAGQTTCDSIAAVRTCGQFDGDTCLDWSPPASCASGQTCSNGTCGTMTGCGQDGASCTDGDACTINDSCTGGTCSGTPKCTSAPTNADPTCSNGTCGFVCHTGYVKSGGLCIRAHRVFVSSASSYGNMNGLAGADNICQSLANAAGLSGVFKAWLADSSTDPASRFVHWTAPYQLVDGTTVANDWADLTDGVLAHAIDHNEYGIVETTYLPVWSGVYANGQSNGGSYNYGRCDDWTSAEYSRSGDRGQLDQTNDRWTQWPYIYGHCDDLSRLYCFEQ